MVKQVIVVLVTSVADLIGILLRYQIPLLYLLSGLQTYHDWVYYYNGKITIILFHLSATEQIPILLLILYNKKIFWTQLPNQFWLHIINSGIVMKNNYFFQEEFSNIRVSFMLGIFIIQRLSELVHLLHMDMSVVVVSSIATN
jgi:hypothetical protein